MPGRREPDDDALWAHVARTVRPLKRRPRKAAPPAAPEPALPPAKKKPKGRIPPAPPPAAPPPRPAPELAPGFVAGLDKRTATRLRRGRLPIEGRIDLHGMTRDEAASSLRRFLRASHKAGRRCVLVITGKGARGGGVIRQEFPRWLNDAELRPLVVAVIEAQPKDGGAGAFYVYLRREREK